MANEVTITVASSAAPTIVEKEALRAMYAARVIARPGVVMYDVRTGKPGQNVDHIELGTLNVNAPGADGTVTNTAVTHTQRQIVLDDWRHVALSVPYRTLAQSVFDYDVEFGKAAGGALGADMDSLVTALQGSFTTNVEGSSAAIMSDALVRAAILDLDTGNVLQENRTFVLHPKAKFELLGDSDFRNANATGMGKGGQVSGILHPLYGVKFVTSTGVVNSSGRQNLLLQEEAVGFAIQRDINIKKHELVGDLTTRYTADFLAGVNILRETFAARITTAA